MKLSLFALVFVGAVLAVNALFETNKGELLTEIVPCNKEHRCALPNGCFHRCYKKKDSDRPQECDNICVHTDLKCQKALNCPREHKCENSKCVPM